MLLNIVSGGDDLEQRRFGDWLGHDERYARTGEFLHIVSSVWRQDSLDFEGQYYNVKDARVSAPPDPLPQIYFGGSSPAALPIAAEYVDVYLTWGEPPQAAAAKIDKVRTLAERAGSQSAFRDPVAHHQPRHLRGGVGGGRRAAGGAHCRPDRQSH